MIATITQKRLFTVAEYLVFEESKQEKYEFHQGKLKKIHGGTLNHNKIAANIIFAIKQELRKSKKKYHVATSDMKI
jgi:Uma2 family endonuclease